MNILDYEANSIEDKKYLENIFYEQQELMDKYHDIEKSSGLLQTEDCPVNLHDRKGQARIKDFCWRVTEEVGEALEANRKKEYDHFIEELIDGLHFLTEMTILVGEFPDTLFSDVEEEDKLSYIINNLCDNKTLPEKVEEFVFRIGTFANCLHNKPWKRDMVLTDVTYTKMCLKEVWVSYINLLKYKLDNSEDIWSFYSRKNQVNKFRQRSNY